MMWKWKLSKSRVEVPNDTDEAKHKCLLADRALKAAARETQRAETMGRNVDRVADNALARARVAARQPEPAVANRSLYT